MNTTTMVRPEWPDGRRGSRALDSLRVLAAHRRLLWRYPLAVSVLIVAVSFLVPNTYRSKVVVLPPERDFQSLSQPAGDLKSVFATGMTLPIMATPSDILAAVLVSRTVRDSLITRLDLEARWEMKRDDVRDLLKASTDVKVAPSGVIEFLAEDEDRLFADTLANTAVELADRLNQRIVNTKAGRTRQFVEQRLQETRAQLDSAANLLERFQNEHRTVALDVEIVAMVEGAASLRAQKTADEIELSVLRESLSAEHPRIRALSTRVAETERKLAENEIPGSDSTRSIMGMGMAELPRLQQELAALLRNVKVAGALYELLTQQYEHARIQERRDTPTFSVLDMAVDGGEKVRPQRLYIGLTTLIAAFGLACGFVLVRTHLDWMSHADPARHESILALWRTLFSGMKRRSKEPGS